jgi:hypothetical protein
MELTADDVLRSAFVTRHALEPLVPRDWSVRAGDLDWDVRRTVAHVCDAVGWYAAHLALQTRCRLRVDFHAHSDASNEELLEVVDAASAMLAAVVRAAPRDARGYHNAGMADTTGLSRWDATRSSYTVGMPFGDWAATFLRPQISPSEFWAGCSRGRQAIRPLGAHCCGRTGESNFPITNAWDLTGPGTARRSTNGTASFPTRMPIHRAVTNDDEAPRWRRSR